MLRLWGHCSLLWVDILYLKGHPSHIQFCDHLGEKIIYFQDLSGALGDYHLLGNRMISNSNSLLSRACEPARNGSSNQNVLKSERYFPIYLVQIAKIAIALIHKAPKTQSKITSMSICRETRIKHTLKPPIRSHAEAKYIHLLHRCQAT